MVQSDRIFPHAYIVARLNPARWTTHPDDATPRQRRPRAPTLRPDVDATFGDFEIDFDGEPVRIAFDATPEEIERDLEAIAGLTDVSVDGSGMSNDPWVITLVDPTEFDASLIVASATGLLKGTITNGDIVTAVLAADPMNIDGDTQDVVDHLNVLGVDANSTSPEIAELVARPDIFSDRLDDLLFLSNFDAAKLVLISYDNSQLFVGLNLPDIRGATTISIDSLGDFIVDLGLPDVLDIETGGDLLLEGEVDLNFEVGVDLGSLEDGFKDEDFFIRLNEFLLFGGIDTNDIDLGISLGSLGASVIDGMLDLDVGIQIELDAEDDNTVSLAELKSQGFSLVTVTPTHSTLDATLPLALEVGGSTAASTTIDFSTDDLFGDISSLIAELPSLGDIADISIDQVIDGIRSALNYVEGAIGSVDEIQRIGHNAEGGTYTISFTDADNTTHTTTSLNFDDDLGTVTSALLALDSGTVFTADDLTVREKSVETGVVYEVEFGGAYAGLDVNQMTVDTSLLTRNEIQTIGHDGDGGTFKLQFTDAGNTQHVTDDIDFDADATAIKDALLGLNSGAIFTANDLEVTDVTTATDRLFEIKFQGTFANTDINQITLDMSLLTLTNDSPTATEQTTQVSGVSSVVAVEETFQAPKASPIADVPLVNEYLADALAGIRTGLDAVENLESASPEDLRAVEVFLQDNLGLAEEELEVSLDDGAIVFDIGLDIDFNPSDPLEFQFSFDQLVSLLDNTNPVKALLEGASNLLDVEGQGDVLVAFNGRVDLIVGFDPNATLGTALFIGDETEITLDAFISATNLNFEANIDLADALNSLDDLLGNTNLTSSLGSLLESADLSTVGITVKNGVATLDAGDGISPASFHFSFEADDEVIGQDDGTGDGRYTIAELDTALIVETSGEAIVDLPLYFPNENLPMGGTTDDVDGDGRADNVFYLEIPDLSSPGSSLQVTAPDIKGSIGLFAILNNIDVVTVIAGNGVALEEDRDGDSVPDDPFKAGILGTLEGILSGQLFGIDLPFIGDSLRSGANFVNGFRSDVRDFLRAEFADAENEVQRIRHTAGFGDFVLTFDTETTAAIPFDDDGSTIESELDAAINTALSSSGSQVLVTQTQDGSNNGLYEWEVQFVGDLAGVNVITQIDVAPDSTTPLQVSDVDPTAVEPTSDTVSDGGTNEIKSKLSVTMRVTESLC